MKNIKRIDLIRRRLELGLSQAAMAQRTGKKMQVIWHVEAGMMPRPTSIPVLAKGYEMTPAEFVAILYKDI